MEVTNKGLPSRSLSWRIGRIVVFTLGGTLAIWLCVRFVDLILAWSLYSRFVEKIREVGGLPDFLSGAIAVWCVAIVILFVPTVAFSIFVKRNRRTIMMSAAAFSIWLVFLYALSVQQSKNLFNPMTGRANFNFAKDAAGNIRIFSRDYSYDPETGLKLNPITHEIAETYRRQSAEGKSLKDELTALQRSQEELRKNYEATRNTYADLKEKYDKQTGELQKARNFVSTSAPVPQSSTSSANSFASGATVIDRPVGPSQHMIPIPPVQAGDLLFKMNGCLRSLTRIRCSGTVTNTGPDPQRFYIRLNESYVVDSFGNQVTLTRQALVFGDGTDKTLQPELSIAFSVILDDNGVPAPTSDISFVLAMTPNKFPLPLERPYVVSMKHIPIVDRQP